MADQKLRRAVEIDAKARRHVEQALHHCYERVMTGRTAHAGVTLLLPETPAVYPDCPARRSPCRIAGTVRRAAADPRAVSRPGLAWVMRAVLGLPLAFTGWPVSHGGLDFLTGWYNLVAW